MKKKSDPCCRPFFKPSVADELRVKLWIPSRDRVDILPSFIFPKINASDYTIFVMGLLVGNETISCETFSVN